MLHGVPRYYVKASPLLRAAYRIDTWLSSWAGKASGLIIAAALIVLVGSGLKVLAKEVETGGDESLMPALGEIMWVAWAEIADPGAHLKETAWVARGTALATTFLGILFFALIVGVVVDGIRQRVEDLRKGRTTVLEAGHYLLLGWTDKSFPLIQELCLALDSEGGGVIVVLSTVDKTQLEGELREHFSKSDLLGTKIVVRCGSPMLSSELSKVSASSARAVVVLAPPGPAERSDSEVVRTVLAVRGMRQALQGHVVAEMRDVDDEGLVEIIGRGDVETLVSHDVIGRLMINCARQPGLADVYEMFLGFEGDEWYIKAWPQLVGSRFGDLFTRFAAAVPVGVTVAAQDGAVLLNPPDDYVIAPGDELLVLAEDDDTYEPARQPYNVKFTAPPAFKDPPQRATNTLMCGWRRDMDDVIEMLDSLSEPGSTLHILSKVSVIERRERMAGNGLYEEDLENVTIVHYVGNPAFRRDLEPLPVESYDSVLLFADEAYEDDALHSDSQSLACLLLLRHLQEQRGVPIQRHAAPAFMNHDLDATDGADGGQDDSDAAGSHRDGFASDGSFRAATTVAQQRGDAGAKPRRRKSLHAVTARHTSIVGHTDKDSGTRRTSSSRSLVRADSASGRGAGAVSPHNDSAVPGKRDDDARPASVSVLTARDIEARERAQRRASAAATTRLVGGNRGEGTSVGGGGAGDGGIATQVPGTLAGLRVSMGRVRRGSGMVAQLRRDSGHSHGSHGSRDSKLSRLLDTRLSVRRRSLGSMLAESELADSRPAAGLNSRRGSLPAALAKVGRTVPTTRAGVVDSLARDELLGSSMTHKRRMRELDARTGDAVWHADHGPADYYGTHRGASTASDHDSDAESDAERGHGIGSSALHIGGGSHRQGGASPPVHAARDSREHSIAVGDLDAAALKTPPRDVVVCCELLDARTRHVIVGGGSISALAGLADYILSNNIIARVLAMVGERREVKAVFNHLLGPDGNEVRLVSALKYAAHSETLSFWEVLLRARQDGAIVLGYKRPASADDVAIVLNPTHKHEPLVWLPGDELIVMAVPQSGRGGVVESSGYISSGGQASGRVGVGQFDASVLPRGITVSGMAAMPATAASLAARRQHVRATDHHNEASEFAPGSDGGEADDSTRIQGSAALLSALAHQHETSDGVMQVRVGAGLASPNSDFNPMSPAGPALTSRSADRLTVTSAPSTALRSSPGLQSVFTPDNASAAVARRPTAGPGTGRQTGGSTVRSATSTGRTQQGTSVMRSTLSLSGMSVGMESAGSLASLGAADSGPAWQLAGAAHVAGPSGAQPTVAAPSRVASSPDLVPRPASALRVERSAPVRRAASFDGTLVGGDVAVVGLQGPAGADEAVVGSPLPGRQSGATVGGVQLTPDGGVTSVGVSSAGGSGGGSAHGRKPSKRTLRMMARRRSQEQRKGMGGGAVSEAPQVKGALAAAAAAAGFMNRGSTAGDEEVMGTNTPASVGAAAARSRSVAVPDAGVFGVLDASTPSAEVVDPVSPFPAGGGAEPGNLRDTQLQATTVAAASAGPANGTTSKRTARLLRKQSRDVMMRVSHGSMPNLVGAQHVAPLASSVPVQQGVMLGLGSASSSAPSLLLGAAHIRGDAAMVTQSWTAGGGGAADDGVRAP